MGRFVGDFTPIHDAKLPKSFNSARWKKGYNPDLIFASESIANMCKKSVMDPIPHTQHRPICVSVQPVVVPQPTPFRRRFNFRKADWNGYSTELDNSIEDVEPIPSNYNRFVENVQGASRRHIPRGCRTDYVQVLTDESKNLYEAYKQQYSSNPFDNRTMESGNLLLDKMTEEKRKIWEEVITSTKHELTIVEKLGKLSISFPMTHLIKPSMSSNCQLSCPPAPRQWQRYHAIQAEATCTTPSNRRRYLKGLPFQRR